MAAAGLRPYALALAAGVAGGALASGANVPLAWMLGPLFACAALSLSGVELEPIPYARELGQAVIGVFVGLRFTPPVLAATAGLLPAMAVSVIYVFGVGMLAALAFRPLAGSDRQTSFFATALAGVAEMVLVAKQRGADAEVVSVVQSLRVALVVVAVPFLVVGFGADGGVPDGEAGRGSAWILLPVFAAAVAAALGFQRLKRFPNPWMFGPLLAGAAVAASGVAAPAPPWPLVVAAQIALGLALGCRFERSVLGKLPRVVAAGVAVSALMIAAAALAAFPLRAATGLDYATSFLALAPAGVTEMVLTAKLMHLDTASVTAFHVVRIVIINAAAVAAFLAFDGVLRRFERNRTL
jgi:membrane AbrB-like protein